MRSAPVHSFEAWVDPFAAQTAVWLDEIRLGQEFFKTLCAHAVPLDPRTLHALQYSALALGIHSWLAHHLCRVPTNNDVNLYWKNLRDQFGQEYKCSKDFKKKLATAVRKILTVYPTAYLRQEHGGMRLFPSPAADPQDSA